VVGVVILKGGYDKTGGLGLGLSIAKAASLRMEGHITVSESHLGGAKFTFSSNFAD
jgi:signal transduction histidine kinase